MLPVLWITFIHFYGFYVYFLLDFESAPSLVYVLFVAVLASQLVGATAIVCMFVFLNGCQWYLFFKCYADIHVFRKVSYFAGLYTCVCKLARFYAVGCIVFSYYYVFQLFY
jgi:hypothetical protein